jgi:serine/threonine protein phosphatase 1
VPRRHIELLAGPGLSHRIGGLFFCHAGIAPGVPLDRQTAEMLLFGAGGVFLR